MRRHVLPLFAALVPAALAAQEQPRVVRGLKFEGNRALDQELLAAAVATTNSSAWATKVYLRWLGLGEKRYFDEVEFRRDVVRLILLYRQSGYMNVVVDTVVRRTARDVYVTFRIHEGEPVRVARLDITGAEGLLNVEALKRELPLRVGDPFNRFLLLASADTVATRLRNRGYPYAEVLRNFDSDAGTLEARVTLEVLPGPRMRIGEVAIEGLQEIDTGTVRRMLSVAPGNVYRQRDLFQSQRDLYGMDVFRSVQVLLADSLPPAGPGDTTVRVLVRVVEGPRHRIRVGAGYGSLDCIRTQAAWSAYDFLGGGRALTVSGRLSKLGVGVPTTWGLERGVCRELKEPPNPDSLNYNLGATLEQPAFLSPGHRASVGVFAERRSEIQAYTRTAIGFNAGVTFNARRAMPLTVSWGYSLGRTSAQAAVYCSVFSVCDSLDQRFLSDRRAFAAVTLTAVRDRVDSPLDPTRGSTLTATLMYASRAVGSVRPYEFNRAEVEFARYYPIGRHSVFAWRMRAGTILPQRITLSGQARRFVPPDQRFYAGGPNSVRGYGRNELGPRVYETTDTATFEIRNGDTVYADLRTAPTGGNSVFVLNAELRLPSPIFRERMRIGAFVDVGQVWERESELVSFERVRITPGVGLRFATPLGPVRLDAAYNGYDDEVGPLYFRDDRTGDLRLYRAAYRTKAPREFLKRIELQFAVGQAF
ncbi:MAG TPA: BamA/TamA family outer membrane protein [Gemmatimonadales bacterium]|nr:BamA/TamA family outer membrane protein [Gemmatimonadales bacterium]